MDKPLKFGNNMNSIPLQPTEAEVQVGTGTVTGWGVTNVSIFLPLTMLCFAKKNFFAVSLILLWLLFVTLYIIHLIKIIFTNPIYSLLRNIILYSDL